MIVHESYCSPFAINRYQRVVCSGSSGEHVSTRGNSTSKWPSGASSATSSRSASPLNSGTAEGGTRPISSQSQVPSHHEPNYPNQYGSDGMGALLHLPPPSQQSLLGSFQSRFQSTIERLERLMGKKTNLCSESVSRGIGRTREIASSSDDVRRASVQQDGNRPIVAQRGRIDNSRDDSPESGSGDERCSGNESGPGSSISQERKSRSPTRRRRGSGGKDRSPSLSSYVVIEKEDVAGIPASGQQKVVGAAIRRRLLQSPHESAQSPRETARNQTARSSTDRYVSSSMGHVLSWCSSCNWYRSLLPSVRIEPECFNC